MSNAILTHTYTPCFYSLLCVHKNREKRGESENTCHVKWIQNQCEGGQGKGIAHMLQSPGRKSLLAYFKHISMLGAL